MTNKPAAQSVSQHNAPRGYIVKFPFKFLGKWHHPEQEDDAETLLNLKPSQAEFFVAQGKLKLKEEGAK